MNLNLGGICRRTRATALVLAALCAAPRPASSSRPPAFVHLAPSSDATRMHVQWATGLFPWPASQGDSLGSGISTVQYGASPRALTMAAAGANWTWTDALSPTNRTYTHHLATMTGLAPGQVYFYRVGVPLDGWSAIYTFRATRLAADVSPDTPMRILFFGDMGWTNAQALSYLQDEVASAFYDTVIDLGDYAYDLPNMDGLFGDEFQLAIQPITATTPLIGAVGNHEGLAGFQHYLHRFRVFAADGSSGLTPAGLPGLLPGLPNNFWLSFDLGLAHFASVSTECYFIDGCPALQAAWLEADLAAAAAPAARAQRPWLIVFAHRSVYCSCDDDCDFGATAVREGIWVNGTRMWGLEPILNRFGVDLFLNAHEHNFERNYAVFNSTLATGASSGAPGGNASAPEVVVDAAAPVYIVEGCAGDKENHEPFTRPQPPYSAFRSNTYGYGRMAVYNSTHLLYEHVQTDNGQPATTGSVIDAMLLVKTRARYPFVESRGAEARGAAAPAAAAPSLSLNVSVASDGDAVLVTVASRGAPAAADWVGLFAAAADLALDAPIKLAYPFAAFPGYNESGAGAGAFAVTNVRVPLVFALFSGPQAAPRAPPLAVSAPLAFDDYSAPLRPRVLPGRSGAAGSYAVAWTSSRADNNPRLEWGFARGGPYPFSAAASGARVERAALFAPPANESGFFDLGETMTAALELGAEPRRVFFRAADDDHPAGAAGGRSEGSFAPAPAPFAPGEFAPASFVAFGDLGIGSFDDAAAFQEYGAAARFLPALVNAEVAAGTADFVVLFGDLSYSVGWLSTWDEFVGLASQFASNVPLLVSPGNHEAVAPGSSSWTLFGADANDSGGEGNVVSSTLFPPPLPATAAEPWYAFASGPFFLISMSSEHDWTTGSAQHAWLSATLAGVDRAAQPWLILTLHRQIYTDTILPDSLNYTSLFQAHVEPLTQRFQVSCVLVGHAHKWERLSATAGGVVVTASEPREGPGGETQHVFVRPRAPVHFIAGMGGADHVINDCRRFRQAPYFMNCTVPAFSEAEGYDQGFLSVTALSATKLRLNYVASVIGPNVTERGAAPVGVVIQSILIEQDLNQTWAAVED